MRLAKYLADAGVASRRAAERFIAAGRVTVAGEVTLDPARDVDGSEGIRVDGVPVISPGRRVLRCLMLHKPIGVVSTMSTGRERGPCLTDIVQTPHRLHPVGRLDRDSSGLLLMTNDGRLTHLLTHPSHGVEKEYLVKTARRITPRDARRLLRGVAVDSRPVQVRDLQEAPGGRVSLVIHEGRRHIVRRLLKEVGHRVLELKRVRVGPQRLGRLPIGKWRYLSPAEMARLKKSVSYDDPEAAGGDARPKRRG